MKKISSLDLGGAVQTRCKPRHFAGELPLVREA